MNRTFRFRLHFPVSQKQNVMLEKIRSWWKRLPQKTRVHLIASVLLVFAGTELFVLAPYILDIALIIDVGGLALVLAALRSSASVSLMQLRALATTLAKPFVAALKAAEFVADFGSSLSPKWHRRYFLFDRIAGRCGAALCVVAVGLALTKSLIVQLWT